MHAQHSSVTGGSVPSVPYPSLVADFLPSLREMEEFLESMLAQVEHIPLWSTANSNHEPVLHSLAEVKGKVSEWRRTMMSSLQSKWMHASAEYTQYKQKVDIVLRKRHVAEIQFLFPALKTAERESQLDPTSLMMMSEEERAVRLHLSALGFGYEKNLEGNSRRVTRVAKRQEKERSVFETTVHNHAEQMGNAKKSDVTRMTQELERSEQLLQSIVSAVDNKIAAASRVNSSTLYHRSSPRQQRDSPPRPAPPHNPRAPLSASGGGGVNRYANSARSDRSNATQLHSLMPLSSSGRPHSSHSEEK